jgi:hypothetical protein
MNSISFFKALLMKELEEKDLPGNQEKIAQAAEPKDKITAADFKALRAKKGMKKEVNTPNPPTDYSGKPAIPGLGPIVDMEEGEDHEVSMASNSLESIIKSAMELKAKMGDQEKDIPAWIQDHITNAENYINQASKNYHEYHDSEHNVDELPDGTEEEPVDDMHNMSLAGLMENMIEEKKKPSAGLTKKEKSAISKKAKAGKDIGKKGKGFEKIAKAAAEKYGSKERGQKVAAAAMWKSAAKKAK